MKVRHIAVGMILSMFIAAPGWAQSHNTNTNDGSFQSFGFGSSFSFFSDNVSITQDVSTDSIDQCFSVVTNIWRIVQRITGNNVEQVFLSPDEEDPCL